MDKYKFFKDVIDGYNELVRTMINSLQEPATTNANLCSNNETIGNQLEEARSPLAKRRRGDDPGLARPVSSPSVIGSFSNSATPARPVVSPRPVVSQVRGSFSNSTTPALTVVAAPALKQEDPDDPDYFLQLAEVAPNISRPVSPPEVVDTKQKKGPKKLATQHLKCELCGELFKATLFLKSHYKKVHNLTNANEVANAIEQKKKGKKPSTSKCDMCDYVAD